MTFWEKLNVLVPAPDCDTAEGVITEWRDGRAQPTQAAIDAVTQPQIDTQNTEDFRTKAKAAADQTVDHAGMSARAIIEVLNKRDNYLVNRIIQLQTAMDDMKASTGAVGNLRAAIPANFMPTQTRPRADAIQDYKDEIDTGSADT
jgi:hypothetical protein